MSRYPEYQFAFPIKLHYGVNTVEKIGEIVAELKSRRIFIVTDGGVKKAGIVEKVTSLMGDTERDIEIYDDVVTNPRDDAVMRGVDRCKDFTPDLMIAIGGGSSIDSAKAIRAVAQAGGKINDYEGFFKFGIKARLPFIAIPTTAGTGSEAGGWAVVTDTKRKFKMGFGDPDALAPTISIVDPALTVSVPPRLTAETGLDAFSHALETYVTTYSSPVTDSMAIYAIQLISRHIKDAWEHGDDLAARAKVMYGSMIAGLAMDNAGCGAIHVLAEVIGGLYNIGHGRSIASFTPHVMKYNASSVKEKMVDVARAMGVSEDKLRGKEAPHYAWKEVARLNSEFGIPRPSELHIDEKEIPSIAKLCLQNMSSDGNPREMSEGEYVSLIKECVSNDLW
jgi:alcohol dehydrogenase